MERSWLRRRLRLAVALGCVAALAGGAAAAEAAAIAPPGYKLINGPNTDIMPSSFDYGGQLACPTGTVVWGGGVNQDVFGADASGDTIETSAPDGSGAWRVRVNDTGPYEAQFFIGAICAKKPKTYKIAFRSVDNPAGAQTGATAKCPSGTVVFSGGALSTSDSSAVQLDAAWPNTPTTFRARMLNGTASDETVTAFAVCGTRPAGYSIKRSTVSVAAGAYAYAGPECPSTSAIIGGGVTASVPGGAPCRRSRS